MPTPHPAPSRAGPERNAAQQGRDAFARRAWAEAFTALSAAGEGSLPPGDLERLAVAAYLVGEDGSATAAWEAAHRSWLAAGNVERAAQAAFWLGVILLLRAELAPAGGWLARAERLAAAAPEPSAGRGYVLMTGVLRALQSGDGATAEARAREVGEIADRVGVADLHAFARLGRGQAAIVRGDARRAGDFFDEAMVVVTADDVSPIAAGIVYCGVIESCMAVFDVRRAGEWTVALARWCAEQPDLVPYRGQCLVHRSQILALHGDWRGAAAEIEEARERLHQRSHPALGVALYQQAELLRLRGRHAAAEEAYRGASRHGRQPMPGLALLRLAQGRIDAAAAGIRRALEEGGEVLGRPDLVAASVEVLLAAGDLGAARAAADELAVIAAGHGAPVLAAASARATGAVRLAAGDPAGALGPLREAGARYAELDMPYEAARTRVLIAEACAGVGDDDAAGLELDGAAACFDELGAADDRERIEATVRPQHGARHALTLRQVEVLARVAAGRTNREIAAELVISEHTVARHLQNIFARLGVSSRAAATAYAYEHRLV